MTTCEVLKKIRDKNALTQDEMAEKLFVTRQAVSRWENGETVPSTESLKLISKTFGVSVNTLLGSPRHLVCQMCGMPLDDDGNICRETDGGLNEEYCKWCRSGGEFAYKSLDDVVNYLAEHIRGDFTVEQAREYYRDELSKLNHWKNQ